ncbi:MAG: cytidylyltransferase domain-containing protein [Spirochaetota bacterium]
MFPSHNTKVNVTAIIQARMQSKRLPGKSMKEIAGKPLLAHVIERSKAMAGVDAVVVATCPGNEPIVELARSLGVQSFVGSESNVLERYYLAAQQAGGDYIVRITGDNPFTDVEYGSMAIEIAVETGADLSSVAGLPLGAGVEVIKREALDTAYKESSTAYQFEHVTPYIKEHDELFTVQRHPVRMKNIVKDFRLTVDTPEDYDLACRIYNELYKGEPFSIREVIAFLAEHPELAALNKDVEQRPMTHSEK